MAETNDLTLYGRWREGKDREAFDELVSRHAPMVFSVCRRLLETPPEAEEAAIEVFQMLAHAPAGPRTHLPTWLHAAAVTRAQQRTRAQHSRPRNDTGTRESKSPEADWESLADVIDAALLVVPWQARIPIIGQYVEDKTQAEIAEEVGLDRQRVISDGVRGFEALRRELNTRGLTVDPSRLKELLSTNMVEPVPSSLAPKLAEQAVADPLTGRRLANGFVIEETVKKGSATGWVIPLAAAAVIAGIAIWLTRGGTPDTPIDVPETGREEIARTDPDRPVPDPRTPQPDAPPEETRPQREPVRPTTPAQPVTETITFAGTVRDDTGSPVAGAKIFAGPLPRDLAGADAAAETGPQGAFTLEDAPAATRQLSVWHEAYKPATVSVSEQTADSIEITLTPAAVVAGVVMYAGTPVSGQTVELEDASGQSFRVRTGENGGYMLSEADPGLAHLRAHLEPTEPGLAQRTMHSAAVLETGLVTDVDFTFGVLDAAIEGTATFNDEPARGARIAARVQTASGGEEIFNTSVQSDSTFFIEALPSGPTILQLQGLRVGRTEHLRSVSLQTRAGQTAIYDFELFGDATVIVQVSGLAQGAQGVVAAIEPGTSLLDFDWMDESLIPENVLARIPLNQDGEYTLEGLEAGACTICAYARPPRRAPEDDDGPEQPQYDAAGITLQPETETVIVLQLR